MGKKNERTYLGDFFKGQMKSAASFTSSQTIAVFTVFPAVAALSGYQLMTMWQKAGENPSYWFYGFVGLFAIIGILSLLVVIGRVLGFLYRPPVHDSKSDHHSSAAA